MMDKFIERACKAFARRKTGYTPDPKLCTVEYGTIILRDADGPLTDYYLDPKRGSLVIGRYQAWKWRNFKQPWAYQD